MPAHFVRGADLRALDDCLLPDPVRNVVSRRTTHVVGLFPSAKGLGMTPYDSQIERDFLYRCEVDRQVVAIAAQPCRLPVNVDGKPRGHIPDFLIKGRDGQIWLAEVKPDKKASTPEYQALFAAAAEECLRRNIGYQVVLESSVRREPSLSNARFLCGFMRIVPQLDLRWRVTATLRNGPASIASLIEASPEEHAYHQVFALILDGTLAVDMDLPLTVRSSCWLCE